MSAAALVRLEWRRLFVRPLGWVLGALTLGELAWRFVLLLGNFLGAQVKLAALPAGPGYTDLVAVPLLSSLFTGGLVPFGLVELALFVVPLLTMSSVAGERGNGTLPLLLSSGLSPARIVLGKYTAVLAWLVLWLALALLMPLSLAHATTLDWGKLAAATLGLVLLLAMLAAIGVACSTFASHPAIAATASLALALGLCCINLGAQAAGVDSGVIQWLALGTHLEPLLRGLVATGDVLWFVLIGALALALATQRLGAERGRG
ncbi:ABC transporter permease [Dyella sp.]|jgi:ABC-2 type transport system permease protein|uniref:ABC transporter permease n=1 Tax=Dyella sp. TaxID=1869338 RepID=UPI002D79ACE4|nr:ABC transporter permease [Dyella sp.]HET6432001.1 ABC transporter permease [Dyella sp.]